MFTMLPKQQHAERRRMLARLYTKTNIQNSPELDEITRKIVWGHMRGLLCIYSHDDIAVDILKVNKACLMDLTTAWLFGLHNGTDFLQDLKAARRLFEAFKQSSLGSFWRREAQGLHSLLRRVGIHLVPQAAYRSRRAIQQWSLDMCDAAMKTVENPSLAGEHHGTAGYPVVYSQLRQGLEQSNLPSHELDSTLSAELLDHAVASHDVAGITTTYLMHELSQRQDLQRSLRKELYRCIGADPSALAHGLDSLPLLDAIVMETLRRHSANPGPWPRRIPAPGFRVGTYPRSPADTVVSASSYTLHRNATVFPEPEDWRPERWLQASVEERKEMMRWFWAFGSGARMCIGNHFAFRGMYIVRAWWRAYWRTRRALES